MQGSGSLSARARIGYGAIEERLADERKADLAAVAELAKRLDESIARLEVQDRRVALGGLRLEVLGLLLTAGGIVVATLW